MKALAAIVYRDYRQRVTNLGFVFWDMFVPIAYLTLFGTGFNRAVASSFTVNGQSLDYATFLLPGVIAMTAFSVAMNTSWGFFMDKDSGIFYELLTYPITRRQILMGKICFNVVLSTVGALLAITVGALLMNVQVRWAWLPLTIGAIILTTAGWFFFLSIFAIRLKRMDSFNTFTSAVYILLMFLSSLFYPMDGLPQWFRFIALANPMTWQVDMLRYTVVGIGSPNLILLETFGFAIFAFICMTFAARALDRAV